MKVILDTEYVEKLRHFLQYWPKDIDEFLEHIKTFAFSISKKMGIKQEFDIQWKFNQNLFIFGSFDTKTKTIFFNHNRVAALQKYKIKSESKNFAEFTEKFIADFQNLDCPDETDKSLYFTLTNKPKDILHLLGNYKYVPFDIATTVLHELRHLYQTEQAELEDPFFVYLTANNLRTLQKQFDPLCEPTEIDALYYQYKILSEYCKANNLQNVFNNSCRLSIPEITENDINEKIKFITNNAELYSTPENIAKLKAEFMSLYKWKNNISSL